MNTSQLYFIAIVECILYVADYLKYALLNLLNLLLYKSFT